MNKEIKRKHIKISEKGIPDRPKRIMCKHPECWDAWNKIFDYHRRIIANRKQRTQNARQRIGQLENYIRNIYEDILDRKEENPLATDRKEDNLMRMVVRLDELLLLSNKLGLHRTTKKIESIKTNMFWEAREQCAKRTKAKF